MVELPCGAPRVRAGGAAVLTWGDDYPIHQTPEPIAIASAERNFYDRYFFNGYSAEGDLFFAAALGVYPQLDVMDASFCVFFEGKQHNIRASRRLNGERMDLNVGPISIEVLAPLKKLRVVLRDNDSGVSADLVFEGRHAPIEEPRFTRRIGSRLFMDYTRLTQNGAWSGSLTVSGETRRIAPDAIKGTRDRSWGIRPVGAPDSQPAPMPPQFFWLWTPFNFSDHVAFFHSNDDADGKPWNTRAVIEALGGKHEEFEHPRPSLTYKRGTRRLTRLDLKLSERANLTIEPSGQIFYMSGLGYTHPVWGHGRDHGALKVAYDVLDRATLDDNAPEHMHIQALARATLTLDGARHEGRGVLEQLMIGPHAPSGFTALLDPAP
jgi:hypothetical protein